MDRLREVRVTRRLSQEAVALELGWSQSRYSRTETGKRPPTERDIAELAKFFGFTFDTVRGWAK